jgi:hypothetical protein
MISFFISPLLLGQVPDFAEGSRGSPPVMRRAVAAALEGDAGRSSGVTPMAKK